MSDLRDAALAVLDANWIGAGTVPAPHQYPHQWSWDSAFISIGWAGCRPERARAELLALFDGQWSSGRLPHIVYNDAAAPDSYFPGADFWRSASHPTAPTRPTSGIVQPPVHARAALTTYQADPGEASQAFLSEMYGKLRDWHAFLRTRDVGGQGLAAIVHPWESGLDNTPLWDSALAGLDRAPGGGFVRRDLGHVASDQRPTDRDYRAYVGLAEQYRDAGYVVEPDEHPFLVEDPLFNAVYLDAEMCLADMAELLGLGDEAAAHRVRARRVHAGLMERLWDPQGRRFAARDLQRDELTTTDTVGCLVPLLDPWLAPDVAADVVALATSKHFAGGCRYPLPSTALDAAQFDRRRYWRGPTWLNTNWLVWLGARISGANELAERVATSSLDLVREHGFREYYDPIDGTGLGAHDFSWTAALAIDWLSTATG
jgi:hypothetical protein